MERDTAHSTTMELLEKLERTLYVVSIAESFAMTAFFEGLFGMESGEPPTEETIERLSDECFKTWWRKRRLLQAVEDVKAGRSLHEIEEELADPSKLTAAQEEWMSWVKSRPFYRGCTISWNRSSS